jgi:hypothetical protein
MTESEATTYERGREAISVTTYRNFTIEYRPKPVPTTAFDWQFCADDYDGPGDVRCGFAGSEEAAKERVDELLEEAGS